MSKTVRKMLESPFEHFDDISALAAEERPSAP